MGGAATFVTPLDVAASVDRTLERGIQHPTRFTAVDTTITDLDRTLFVDASAGNRLIKLPSAVGLAGMHFEIKRTDASTFTVSIVPGIPGQTIDGAPSADLIVPLDSIEVVSDGLNWFSIARIGTEIVRSREEFQFGRVVVVPAGGTLQLQGAGNSLSGVRMMRAGRITGASIQVNVADLVRSYNLEIRLNGVTVETLLLPSGSTGAQTSTLSTGFVAGDRITTFLVRTSGAGASTFSDEQALVEVTV